MKDKKLIASVTAVTALSLTSVAAIGAVGLGKNAQAEKFAYETFVLSGCYSETNIRVPESTGITDARRGLKITAQQSGAKASLDGGACGVFDFEFMPYSSSAYGGSDYESTTYDNSYQDIREMSLVFTDKADESNSFKVRLTGGADGNNVTVNASVEADGARAGIYYYKDNMAYGGTSGANGNGVYTFLYGSGFSNTAVGGGAYSPENVRPVRIIFDPDEMKVYGCNYGYNAYSSEMRLIWDLSQQVNDGRDGGFTLDGFDSYTVDVVFDDVKSGAEGNIIVYSINGYGLGGSVLSSVHAPDCYVADTGTPELGKDYVLPVPACYDVADGILDFEGTVKAIKPDGQFSAISVNETDLVLDRNGYAKYEAGAKIRLDEAGEYEIVYTAKNPLNGMYGKPYSVKIEVPPDDVATFSYSGGSVYNAVGDMLDAPVGKFYMAGNEVTATYKVYDPYGKEISSPYKLDKPGRYKIVYSADIGGAAAEDEVSVYALESNAGLFGGSGSVSLYPGKSELHSDLSGLIAETTANNGVVTYNMPVKIKQKTKDDTLISLMALPVKYGSASFSQIAIKLTDGLDASNYVSVIVSSGSGNDTSVVRAASAEQTLSGLNGAGSIESFAGGGTVVLHSFHGVSNYKNICEQFIDLRFDYAQKRVYIGNKLVCDLDDNEHFGNVWEGFSSDEIVLSVTMRDVNGTSAKMLISEVDGKKMTGGFYADCVAPVISALFDESDIPTAVVGKKYPVLPISLADGDDEAPVYTVTVTDETGASVAVENGAFVPTRAGKYTLTYTAYDYTGNTSVRSFVTQAYESADELTVGVASELETEICVGMKYLLPEAVIEGGCGNVKLTVTAVGKKSGTRYDITDGVLKVTAADDYTVEYKATDYLGNTAVYTAEVRATVSDAPVFDDLTVFPDLFISGVSKAIPKVTAYDYKANAAAQVEVYVSIDGGDDMPINGFVYTPDIDGASCDAVFKYVATAKDGTKATEVRQAEVVNLYDRSGNLDITRYFRTSGVDGITANDEFIAFEVSKSGAEISFVKEVYAHGFELLFDVPSAANNTDKITVTLTDAADSAKSVRIDVVKGGFADDSSKLIINGTQELSIAGNFFDSVRHMRIAYFNNNYAIKDATGLTVGHIRTYANGEPFRGFSDTVDFGIKFGDVDGIVEFELYKVGNQLMMENDGDYTPPEIVLGGDLKRSVEKGGELTVCSAKAFDVLGFETTLSVSVRSGNEYILRNASCDTEHTVVLPEYGEYFVEYRAEDENYNVNNYTLVVNVRDNVPPTIKVDTEERVVYAGSSVSVPKAAVTDDVSVDRTYVFVIDTRNDMKDITGQSSFVPEEKGTYIIRYVAIDTAGNYAVVDAVVRAV